MKGFWSRFKAMFGRPAPPALESGEVDGVGGRPYQVRETSPASQLAVRVALWGLVGLGALGGVVGMLRPAGGSTQVVADDAAGDAGNNDNVPAPVADVAERAVEAWLTATSDDEELLEVLYAEPPEPNPGNVPFAVMELTAVAGGQWEPGYWVVTFAVELAECVASAGENRVADDPETLGNLDCSEVTGSESEEYEAYEEDPAGVSPDQATDGVESGALVAQTTTWFVEVGVVGDLYERVIALGTPSVLEEPPTVSGWESHGASADTPNFSDPLTHTIEEFLNGWLAGIGDPSRYAAPGVEVNPANPAVFTELNLVGLTSEEQGENEVLVRAHARATSAGGVTVPVTYELEVTFWGDRWEVLSFWGAPTLSGRPG